MKSVANSTKETTTVRDNSESVDVLQGLARGQQRETTLIKQRTKRFIRTAQEQKSLSAPGENNRKRKGRDNKEQQKPAPFSLSCCYLVCQKFALLVLHIDSFLLQFCPRQSLPLGLNKLWLDPFMVLVCHYPWLFFSTI